MQQQARAPLGFGFVVAVLMLITGAIIWALFAPAVDTLFTVTGSKTTSQAASNHQSTIQFIWNNLAYWVAFVTLLFLIARAYFESRRPV